MKLFFRPKLADTLPGYNREQFTRDLSAGITVGVLALPLAMAFAIASGVAPSAGIWTAIVAGFIIAALGGSRVQIGGPTGAFIVIVYGIVAQYGLANLLIATMLAGLIMIGMGVARLGALIRFIPVTVVIGFTNGIAVLIFISQIKEFLGLDMEALPAEFFAKMKVLAANLPNTDLPTLTLATASLVLLVLWNKRVAGRIPLLGILPGPLAVLIVGTAAQALVDFPVETIGSRFGGIPQTLPAFALPELSLSTLRNLISPAITIALLGAIESLLSARVADSQIDDRHDPNQELIAQGIANLVAPVLGGFAATGAIARTSTNVRAGGRTPVAGIIHSATLLAIVLVAAPLASYVPLATLSAILMVVAWNMGEWHEFKELPRYSMNYRVILLSTFIITVVFDLTLAVEIGMLLASLLFIYRMSELTRVERLGNPAWAEGEPVVAYSLYGSLFFGAVGKLQTLIDQNSEGTRLLILDMHQVINLDTTGLDTLEALQRLLAKRGGHLILAGLNSQPGSLIFRSGFTDLLGDENIVADLADAWQRAAILLPPGAELEASADAPA
ncbi:MAG TPA: SulP family inorganic anion transporter [Azospira sp.]|nr:SulP family inorganic anion transporter [Azospira sp.]